LRKTKYIREPALAGAEICTRSQPSLEQEGEPPVWVGFVSSREYLWCLLVCFYLTSQI